MGQRVSQSQAALLAALRDCRGGLEAAIRARIEGDDAPTEAADPEYGAGLRAAIPLAIDYGLDGIERGAASPPPLPTGLLFQARIAARSKVPLGVVMRRYFAGYVLLGDFMAEEAEEAGLDRASDLKRLLRSLAATFDQLIVAVSEEYSREAERLTARPSARRRAELVERLIRGEPLDAPELGYDFNGWHLGAIAKGPRAGEALRNLAKALDRRLLALARDGEVVWAWLGGRCPVRPDDVNRVVADCPPEVRLALGEPAEGPAGWRLTHRQARAALPIALHGSEPFVRYADVALLASILRDDLLATSLREIYLEPLQAERDGGEVLRETLRAYFAAGRNVSSTAAALRVNRETVRNRLRVVEVHVGLPLNDSAVELDVALRFEGLRDKPPPLLMRP